MQRSISKTDFLHRNGDSTRKASPSGTTRTSSHASVSNCKCYVSCCQAHRVHSRAVLAIQYIHIFYKSKERVLKQQGKKVEGKTKSKEREKRGSKAVTQTRTQINKQINKIYSYKPCRKGKSIDRGRRHPYLYYTDMLI